MSVPLQLSVPEGAHVQIHIVPAGQTLSLPGPIASIPAVLPRPPKRRPLRLATAAMLVFGAGYVARSLVTPDANAQPGTASLAAPSSGIPPAGYGDAIPPAIPGLASGLPSSIQVNPLPFPYVNAPGPTTGTLARQVSPYGVAPSRGMSIQAPFPAGPDPGQPQPDARLVAPARPPNPFGLQ